jgi:enoyl-CoA hydratase/carnithine racemase
VTGPANQPVVLTEPGRVWRVTLNRPEARNAISSEVLRALSGALADAAADPACRAVVIAGNGQDFCAGADVRELLAARDGGGAVAYGQTFELVLTEIERHPRPVIAAVQGSAFGAGCQISVACDLVVTAEDARFGIPSARLGIVIGFENVARLAAAVGPKRAGEMLLSARTLTGVEAVDWGLANVWVEAEALAAATDELAERVAELAPLSVSASKAGLRAAIRSDQEGGRALFEAAAADAFASDDLLEGLTALRERRSPRFGGR